MLKSLERWHQTHLEDQVSLTKFEEAFMLPTIDITIDDGLGYTIKIYGWLLLENHGIYKIYKRSMKNISVKFS